MISSTDSFLVRSFVLGVLIVLTTGWCVRVAHAQAEGVGLLINEFMASNTANLDDEDGDYPDWIELFNAGNAVVELAGYGLSDDIDEPFKWVFQHGLLEPGGYRLIFASGKDRTQVPDRWELVVDAGDQWRYFVGLEAPPIDWHRHSFDAGSWLAGPGPFGYKDEYATVLPRTVGPSNQTSVYLSTRFELTEPSAVLGGFLHLEYQDAFVAYINGREVARANIGEAGTPPAHDQIAEDMGDLQGVSFALAGLGDLLVAGENVLAIQVHSLSAVHHLSVRPQLILGSTGRTLSGRALADQLDLPRSQHTNFKIKNGREGIYLSAPNGLLVDWVKQERLPTDFAWGRLVDGDPKWMVYPVPTPGMSNTTQSLAGVGPAVEVAPKGGFYFHGTRLTLSVDDPQAQVFYTLDGSDPGEGAEMWQYEEPIVVDSTAVVKARAFVPGLLAGPVSTHSYFVGRDFALPVISLSTHPDNFFDDKIGIYVKGTNKSYENQRYKANYGEDWERPLHIEFFEPDGSLGFSAAGGVKIIGLAGRTYPRKGMALFARKRYGSEAFEHRVFPDLPIERFTSLVLRNSGRDVVEHSTLFRDELCQALVSDLQFDQQAYRPCIVYINGAYWGIHNIREKQNEDYLASHHGVDPDRVDILELYHGSPPPIVVEGESRHYDALIAYLEDHSMSEPEHYEYVKTQMYMDHFISYIAAEIYLGNVDWLGNNVKFWRPQTPDGRWRWMLFDIDWGLGRARGGVEHNTLAMATDPSGPGRYPAWTTFLIRRLFASEDFVRDFANRSADLMNSIFLPERVDSTLQVLKATIEPEVDRHFARWGGDRENWERNLSAQSEYVRQRPVPLRRFISQHFDLGAPATVALDVAEAGTGIIQINSLVVDTFPWTGVYFKEVPIELTALPAPGYRFAGWADGPLAERANGVLMLEDNVALKARFVEDTTRLNRVVINEIRSQGIGGDWVELYNGYQIPVDVSDWVFNDEEDTRPFAIPGRTVIPPDGYLVLCSAGEQFRRSYPGVDNYIGDFGFGLNRGGERIRLFDRRGVLVDALTYDREPPWPLVEQDHGATLSLLRPDLDNERPGNWAQGVGSPGRPNRVPTVVDDQESLPIAYWLGQNYPNPFNATTVIPFSLPRDGRVRIDLYSVLGQRLATPVAADLPAGYHKATLEAAALAGGLYLYTIQIGEFTQTRSMILLK